MSCIDAAKNNSLLAASLEARRENRVLIFGSAEIADWNYSLTGDLVNMSPHGMMLRFVGHPAWLQTGSVVRVRVFGAVMSVEVRHVSRDGGRVVVGVKIIDPAPEVPENSA
jgi:hypothetical protein